MQAGKVDEKNEAEEEEKQEEAEVSHEGRQLKEVWEGKEQ